MPDYILLLAPSHNRLYASQSGKIALAELSLLQQTMPDIQNIALSEIDNAPCVTFTSQNITPLLPFFARSSGALLLFEVHNNTFAPVMLGRMSPLEEDLVSIPKYSGKTNEQFTRLMINAALWASDFRQRPPSEVSILDPLCGRGTALFEAVLQKHPAAGIETDKKEVDWGVAYFEKYLETKRQKHRHEQANIADQTGTFATRHLFTFAPDKETLKTAPQTLEWIRGDTRQATRFWKKKQFELIVADLPYGIQHGATADSGSFTRNPTQLLDQSLPGWKQLLAPGGGLALSWNVNVCKYSVMQNTLERHGLTVLQGFDFEHRVDQAILRDLIVARNENPVQ